ncbi:hypothetical protein DQ238_10540 [Geodermatophilus sp. TF02-6]|nr:hypothetical protein DQ238_10540 [Geodermatophilus sp. TF02-6]
MLFCSSRFHDLNAVAGARRWRYEHRRDGRLVGVLDGVVSDGVLLSGHSAPFGGPDLVRSDPPVEDVVGLVEGALAAARAAGVGTVRIRCRPSEYSAAEPLVEYALLHLGATVEHCDLNQYVDLRRIPADGDALALLGRKRARDVRADLRLPYQLTDVDDGENLTVLHGILAANRAAHGRPPGLSRDYLGEVRRAFPDRVRLSLLRHAGRPVASAVVYRVLRDVDLLVAWGDAVDHGLQRSPMNLLAHHLVTRSARTGARLLDLGPSSEKDGTPNLGLAHFKRSVGASTGTRKVLVVTLG